MELWQHQKEGIERARNKRGFAFFFEQGCGKSRTVIEVLKEIRVKEGRPLRTLIVCPDIVVQNWANEYRLYDPDSPVTTVTGSGVARAKILRSAPPTTTFVCNYQTLLMPECLSLLLASDLDALVLDESQKIKTYNSKTTKAAIALSERAKHRYCLSGTPLLNREWDIWPQIKVLDGGDSLGHNFFTFRNRFFYDKNRNMPRGNYFPKWEIKDGSKEEIKRLTADFTMRVEKATCLDLPPLIRQTAEVELTSEQERLYRQLEKEMVGALGEHLVVSDMALTNIIRMQQLVSGFCTSQIGQVFKVEGNRDKVLKEVLETIPSHEKVIIWACFKQNYYDIRRVLESMNANYQELTGETIPRRREPIINAFRNGDTRVLLANPQAAGIGINLVEAAYSVYYSRSYSLEADLQSEARNYRAGSEMHEKVVRIDLLTRNTIDEVIFNALASKGKLNDAILNHYHRKKR